jgi:F0F1-type ATP synthase assembly protein I
LVAFTVVLTSVLSLFAPQKASEELISKATGVAGTASIHALIKSVTLTPWGVIAIVLGVIGFGAGIYLLATFRRWPVASRKYQAVRFEKATGERDAVIDWDALSEGEDPTNSTADRP